MGVLESNLEKTIGARLDAMEARLKDLGKALPEGKKPEVPPKPPVDLYARLDEISKQVSQIATRLESKPPTTSHTTTFGGGYLKK